MAKQSTTTVVLHDAHVAARAAAGAAFVATYQSICCFIAAVAVACVARRAAAKLAAAPAVSAAKKAAAVVAKLLKAANATRLAAVRATRAANAAIATIKAAKTAIDCATTHVGVTRSSTADKRAVKAAVVAFLAQTPCLCALWFYATLDVADKAAAKDAAKAANKVHASIRAPRVPMNDAEKRAAITLACANARAAKAAKRAADAHDIAIFGSVMSPATIAARKEQGAAQRAANAARKAGMPTKTPRPHVVIVRSGPVKNKGAKRTKVHHMVHTVESVMAQVTKKAAIVKAKEDAQIAKAKKWAMRKAAYANRKAAMEQIASDAWMLKGVWLSEDLIRGANDWSYQVRISAFKEARNIAYAKAPVTQAVVAA